MAEQRVFDILWREAVILESRLFRAHADAKHFLNAIRPLRNADSCAKTAVNKADVDGSSPAYQAPDPSQPSLVFGSGSEEDYD